MPAGDTASRLASVTDVVRRESRWLMEQTERVTSEMDQAWPIMREARRRIRALETALKDMLPENCGQGDDPAGSHRPSFEKCERARALLATQTHSQDV